MKKSRFLLLIAVSASVFSGAWAQQPGEMPGIRSSSAQSPTRNVQEATSETGTILKKDLRWNSKIPLNKTYGELNEAQKAELFKMYESLPPGDEPPFPAEGIKPIFTAIKNAQRVLQARGALDMAVTVGPDGKATKVDDFSNLRSTQMAEVAQQVLLLTKYKPGMCNGSPCTMQYRFQQKLKGG
ncbi:MAG: hypothetical protein ABI821_17610 [Pseudomonadota bacterium]